MSGNSGRAVIAEPPRPTTREDEPATVAAALLPLATTCAVGPTQLRTAAPEETPHSVPIPWLEQVSTASYVARPACHGGAIDGTWGERADGRSNLRDLAQVIPRNPPTRSTDRRHITLQLTGISPVCIGVHRVTVPERAAEVGEDALRNGRVELQLALSGVPRCSVPGKLPHDRTQHLPAPCIGTQSTRIRVRGRTCRSVEIRLHRRRHQRVDRGENAGGGVVVAVLEVVATSD